MSAPCARCGGPTKPLFTGVYCAAECDRPRPPVPAPRPEWREGLTNLGDLYRRAYPMPDPGTDVDIADWDDDSLTPTPAATATAEPHPVGSIRYCACSGGTTVYALAGHLHELWFNAVPGPGEYTYAVKVTALPKDAAGWYEVKPVSRLGYGPP